MEFPQGHALIIGAGPYQLEDYAAAEMTAADAAALAAILGTPERAGYPPDQVAVLTGAAATYQGISQAFERLIATTTSDSTVFIFLSGHGVMERDVNEYFFLPNDVTLAAPDRLDLDKALGGPQLLKWLKEIRAHKVLVIFNTCFAGRLTVSTDPARPTERPHAVPDLLADAILAQGEGWAVLSACRADQQSWFTPGALHTLFGQMLLQAFSGEARLSATQGGLSLATVYDYVYHQVSTQVRRIDPEACQEPVLTILDEVGPFLVGWGQQDPAAPATPESAPSLSDLAAVRRIDRPTAQEADRVLNLQASSTSVVMPDNSGLSITQSPGAVGHQERGITNEGGAQMINNAPSGPGGAYNPQTNAPGGTVNNIQGISTGGPTTLGNGAGMFGNIWGNPTITLDGGASRSELASLERIFAEARQQLGPREADSSLKSLIDETQQDATAVQQTAEQPAGEPPATATEAPDTAAAAKAHQSLDTHLRGLIAMAPDIAKVILASLTAPAAGIAEALVLIARRAQALLPPDAPSPGTEPTTTQEPAP